MYVRRLKTVKWGFFTPFAHYSWEPELVAMVIFQTVSVGNLVNKTLEARRTYKGGIMAVVMMSAILQRLG